MEQAARYRRLLPDIRWTAYWELLRNLSVKNIKVKSRRTWLGLLWSVINPAALIAIYFFAFRVVLGVEPVANYALYVAVGVVHWVYFAGIIAESTNAVVRSAGILDKVAFPRLVLPLSSVLAKLIEHGFAVLALALLFVPIGGELWVGIWTYIPILLLATAFCAGVAMAFSALGVLFRDLSQIVPIALRVLFFASPVLYRFQRLPEDWQRILSYNPLAIYLDGIRAPLFENEYPSLEGWALMVGIAAASLAIGYIVFHGMKRNFTEWL